MKFEPPVRGLARRLYRLVVGGSLPFQNEIAFYSVNSSVFPDIDVDASARLILIKYEEPSGAVTPADVTPEFVSHLAAEIGALSGHTSFSRLRTVLFRLLNGPISRSFRDLMRSRAFLVDEKLRLAAKLFGLWMRGRCQAEPARIIHNDLMLHNVLRRGDTFRAIDFEDCLLERVWIYADMTDLIFQSDGWSYGEIIGFLGNQEPYEMSETRLRDHYDYGFLRFHIRATTMTRLSSAEKKAAARRVKDWLDGKA